MKRKNKLRPGQLWVYRNLGAEKSFDLLYAIDDDGTTHWCETWIDDNSVMTWSSCTMSQIDYWIRIGDLILIEDVGNDF